jgi:hypothetical protein
MRLYAATTAPQRQKTDCAIVGLHEGGRLSVAGVALDAALKGRLIRLIKRGDVHGRSGELRLLDTDGAACDRVLLVGLGKAGSFGRKQYRKALVSALGVLAKTGARDAVSYLGEALAEPDAYYDARLAAEALGAQVIWIRGHRGHSESGGTAWPGPRPGDRRRHRAHPRSRQPASQRLYAGIPGAAGEGTRPRAQGREGAGAGRARAAAPEDGIVPVGHQRHR